MAEIRLAEPEGEQKEQEVVTENRGYWGYREVGEDEKGKAGLDEGGCGCGGCGCGCGK